ncbi:MAG: hypothetical protein KFF77_02595 [Bacteroidetes bacterium]|nr:hypothetical protein [Bacteroidota bacterium]
MRTESIFLLLFLLPALTWAGNPPGGEEDILRPVPWRFHAGPFAGAAWVVSQGTFQTLCNCEYGSGDGLGLQAGAFIDYPLAGDLSIFGTFGYRLLTTSYDKTEQRLEFVPNMSGGQFVWVDFDLETRLMLSMVELGAAVKWDLPLDGLYLAVGPEFGWIFTDNIEETERIQTAGFTYDESGRTEQNFMDDALDRYYDGAASFRLALAARLGYIYPLHERLAIAPELLMSMPLTPVASEYSSWRLGAWQFNVYLRFAI